MQELILVQADTNLQSYIWRTQVNYLRLAKGSYLEK